MIYLENSDHDVKDDHCEEGETHEGFLPVIRVHLGEDIGDDKDDDDDDLGKMFPKFSAMSRYLVITNAMHDAEKSFYKTFI